MASDKPYYPKSLTRKLRYEGLVKKKDKRQEDLQRCASCVWCNSNANVRNCLFPSCVRKPGRL